jgi:hypothetical protein
LRTVLRTVEKRYQRASHPSSVTEVRVPRLGSHPAEEQHLRSRILRGTLVPAVWSKGRFYSEGIGEATDDTHTVTWDDGSTSSIVEATKIIAE